MKKNISNDKCKQNCENYPKTRIIFTQRSERSSSSNVLQQINCNKYLQTIMKKNQKERKCSQEYNSNCSLDEIDTKKYKQEKINQLKFQLQILKQNLDRQSKNKYNLTETIDKTIKQLQEAKSLINFQLIDEPWKEVIQIEKDINLNEENILNHIPLNNFNEIMTNHQITFLELTAQYQALSQQYFWSLQINLLHEAFLKKNQILIGMLQPHHNLEESIIVNDQISQSFGKQF